VKFVGGKCEEVKSCFSFSFHWLANNGTFQGPLRNGTFQGPLNNGTFQRPPNNGTFQRPPNNETFHWPPTNGTFFHLFPSPSLEEDEFRSFGALFPGHNFQFKYLEYWFPQPYLKGEK
jgi:hypothetical protein